MEKPLKILMLNYEFPPIGGGGGKAHRHLLKEYAKRPDLHIDVLTSAPKPGNTIEQFSSNITIYKTGLHKKKLHYWRKIEVIEWLMKAKKQLTRLMSNNTYDFAHAFFGFPTGWLTYLERKQLPYIISLRGSDVPGANPRLKLDYKLLAGLFHKIWKHADLLVANSSGLAERARSFEPDLDVHVIPNGVDTNRFIPAQDKPPLTPFKLITVGRLSQVKRLDLAIQSVGHAKKLGMDIEFTIVGNGNLMSELKKLAHALNISDCVTFTDWIEPEKMPGLYQTHHAFMLTSINEGMNNAMMEALACGLPVISTPCEGTEELIGENGIIIQNPAPGNFADAMVEMTQDQSQYDHMSDCSRKTAQNFSWTNAAAQYLRLYDSVIKL